MNTAAVMMTPAERAVYEVVKQNLGSDSLWQDVMALAEQGVIKAALEVTHGNQTEAAQLLGIHRHTLRTRVARYELRGYGAARAGGAA